MRPLNAARKGLRRGGVPPSRVLRLRFSGSSTERTTAIGIWVSSYSVGAAIGPLLGGMLLEHFWWGSVFLVGVPVMALPGIEN